METNPRAVRAAAAATPDTTRIRPREHDSVKSGRVWTDDEIKGPGSGSNTAFSVVTSRLPTLHPDAAARQDAGAIVVAEGRPDRVCRLSVVRCATSPFFQPT